MRATSKRLCFIASMARSNRTLSGCLEPTFASGLLTFLLVQAAQYIRAPRRIMTGKRRDIRTSGKWLSASGRLGSAVTRDLSHFLQCRLGGGLQQLLGICPWITAAEHRVA